MLIKLLLIILMLISGCRWSTKTDARERARARRRHMMMWRAERATRWKIVHSCTRRIWRREVCVLLMTKRCIIWLKQWNGIWTLQKWFSDDGRSVKHRGLELMPITFLFYLKIYCICIFLFFSLKSFSHIDLDHQTTQNTHIILDTNPVEHKFIISHFTKCILTNFYFHSLNHYVYLCTPIYDNIKN